jgi:hypothetical protein
METLNNKHFWAVCDVCGQRYDNWVGSTPCCGSLASIYSEKDFRKDKLKVIIGNIKYNDN